DTGADESVSIAVEVDAPRVARSFSENLELPGPRLVPGHGGSHLDPGCAGFGDFDLGMSEDSMRQVEAAIRAPGEAIQQLMPIVQAEPGQQHLPRIGYVVVVGVLEKKKIRGLSDVSPSVAEQQAGGEVLSVGKRG